MGPHQARHLSRVNIESVPAAHVHGPLCNDCAHYRKQSPGFCQRSPRVVRCVKERAWAMARCGPRAKHFTPKERTA